MINFLSSVQTTMPSLGEVFEPLWSGINACWDWFQSLTLAGNLGWYELILGVVFGTLFIRLIFMPFFGGHIQVGSDSVRDSDSFFEETKTTSSKPPAARLEPYYKDYSNNDNLPTFRR